MQSCQLFMSVAVNQPGIDYHVVLAQNALQQCLDMIELQAELICILVKQTSRHTSQKLGAGVQVNKKLGKQTRVSVWGGNRQQLFIHPPSFLYVVLSFQWNRNVFVWYFFGFGFEFGLSFCFKIFIDCLINHHFIVSVEISWRNIGRSGISKWKPFTILALSDVAKTLRFIPKVFAIHHTITLFGLIANETNTWHFSISVLRCWRNP